MRNQSKTICISCKIWAVLLAALFVTACGGSADDTGTLSILTTSSATHQTDLSDRTSNSTTLKGAVTSMVSGKETSQLTTSTSVSTPTSTLPNPTAPSTSAPGTAPETDNHSKSELVRVQDYISDLYVNLRYSGSDNDAGRSIYEYTDAYLRYGTVLKLEKVQKKLREQGLSLMIWDAWRPLKAQYDLSVVLPDKGTSPVNGKVAFNYGGTLSVAIVKADGTAVELPSDFDQEGKISDRDFSDVSTQAAKYGQLLDDLMCANGFDRYLGKWYRYTDSNSYSLVTTKTLTKDGIADCETWYANCQSTLNLRSGPSTSFDILTKIPDGAKVKVVFFYEKFAFVNYGGTVGYVSTVYIRPKEQESYRSTLSTITVVEKYTYEMMNEDLTALAEEYPNRLRLSSIGKSEEGRDLVLAVLGNPDGKYKIFVSAGIHAREYMNSTLAMAQIEYMLRNQGMVYQDQTVGEVLDNICFYIVPMSNPDGIVISQTEKVPAEFADRYGSATARIWKANAKGIDLNANFDADWDKYGGKNPTKKPGYMGYKGTSPECAAESKALGDFVRSIQFDLVLCYHCTGSVIYWEYGTNKEVNAANRELATLISSESGFLLADQGSKSTAGLKDYVIDKLGIPALTIEFGSADCPLGLREFESMWQRCKNTLLISALWVSER